MFSHRYFHVAPVFTDQVDPSHLAREALPRELRLSRFAHDLLGWFEEQPLLARVKLSAVAIPELERMPTSVRIRHHFTLHGEGGTVPDAEDYALACLPWSMLGAGVFQLGRSDELVQRYLALPDNEPFRYQGLVHELSLRIDTAFDLLYINHDLGLRTASR